MQLYIFKPLTAKKCFFSFRFVPYSTIFTKEYRNLDSRVPSKLNLNKIFLWNDLAFWKSQRFISLPWIGQSGPQWPNSPAPVTWFPLASTWVEHQRFDGSSRSTGHELYSTPSNRKGNTHCALGFGPPTVLCGQNVFFKALVTLHIWHPILR